MIYFELVQFGIMERSAIIIALSLNSIVQNECKEFPTQEHLDTIEDVCRRNVPSSIMTKNQYPIDVGGNSNAIDYLQEI